MGMDLEYIPARIRPRLHRRMTQGIKRRIRDTYLYDTTFWRTAISGLWIVCFLAFTTAVLGIPTGLGIPTDIVLAVGASTIILVISSNIIAVLITLTGLRIPRLFTGCVLSVLGAILLILYFADVELEAAALVAVILTLLGALGGLAIGLLRNRRFVMGLLLIFVVGFSQFNLAKGIQEQPILTPLNVSDSGVAPLTAPNPGEPGTLNYQTFTYASGNDLHRSEFGRNTSLISSTVDASAYIKDWPKLRTLFWGFDYKALPLNGRVWMPEGTGPYPVVLMVHGNHMMEDYSDGGYAYLGELLASRGFITISLDENYLNYSAWTGIPDDDFKVRTWMILKHLEQLAKFSDEPDNPFYQKIDFTKTALLGHSRGGQAVAMAADPERWFKNDPLLTAIDRFTLTSVIALAPTDKSIDDQQARLKNISYLALQGARDGDVHDFYGDRQYIRSSYSQGSSAFKSSLYIADANHSQFNSDWGGYDQTFPGGLFLNRAQIMDANKQRQIAKVYVSAFLETTLHGKNEYQSLFRDYRRGLQWLPDTVYYNRYQDGDFRPVATFDEDRNKNIVGLGTAEALGVSWIEELAKDRESKSKATYGVVVERTVSKSEEAYYKIKLKNSVVTETSLSGATGLTFSLANLNGDLKDSLNVVLPPLVEVELTDSNGNSARLPLSEVMKIAPLPQTQFTLYPWLEERINDGKYGDLSEAVFQTYELPFDQFKLTTPTLLPESLTTITFYLKQSGDKVMLDDIGFY